MNVKTTAAKTTATTASPATKCACGCGRAIGRKSTFAMGHDAKMVSLLAADLATGNLAYTNQVLGLALNTDQDIQANMDDAAKAVEGRFGAKLATKYTNAAHSAWSKAVGKQDKAAKATEAKGRQAGKQAAPKAERQVVQEHTVKIGRWEYPSRKWSDGAYERNTKRDGSGEWVPVA